ncbi:hypothetical protein ROZALSC1DRAFT_27870 [Rozella allomycis CSF55]|uniref:Mediator of RNA polymerase II transcription subunit 18 n=1 Tax=Rozella allomycis (strain CSF55) TaxID=988480 RepID=A0A075B0J6_ROZAC|nr:hypothetical protein O9G_002689 [Rozella allomycis CSF55]RKP20670.1 hypothetical protein ROZALSC1DRAFT_27870 [Rozella allomycis CSF55]|eukprot:EPZ36046.1 hypothetical protein O9G_002689 [Rozella allomycis CSF55]
MDTLICSLFGLATEETIDDLKNCLYYLCGDQTVVYEEVHVFEPSKEYNETFFTKNESGRLDRIQYRIVKNLKDYSTYLFHYANPEISSSRKVLVRPVIKSKVENFTNDFFLHLGFKLISIRKKDTIHNENNQMVDNEIPNEYIVEIHSNLVTQDTIPSVEVALHSLSSNLSKIDPRLMTIKPINKSAI